MIDTKRLLIFVSGLSGAGKTTALSIFNDMDFHTVDNLPIQMIDAYLDNIPNDSKAIAFGFGVRSVGFSSITIVEKIITLKKDYDVRLIFLKANSVTLHQRYSLTGMTHPLCHDGNLERALTEEYQICTRLIENASLVIDTDNIGPKELRRTLISAYENSVGIKRPLFIISSFGFKYGIPKDAEMIFDARILKNPHWNNHISHLTGKDKLVQEFLQDDNKTNIFLDKVTDYIMNITIPYINKDKSFYHIAIGCTGGKHRSVYCAEKIYEFLKSHNIYCRVEHKIID